MLVSWRLDLFSSTLESSSTDTLLLSKYWRSVLDTFSSSRPCTSSKLSLLSTDEATSAIVRDTSETLAFKDKPAFNSDLFAFVGSTLSISRIASPYDLTTSHTALNVNFTISCMFFHSLDPYISFKIIVSYM